MSVTEVQTRPALEVSDLRVRFGKGDRAKTVVNEVSLSIAPGEVLGLVGESGSGKSMLASACLGLLPRGASVSGQIHIDGTSVTDASEARLRDLRGGGAAMVFQNPMTSLNPYFTIGRQLSAIVRCHRHGLNPGAVEELLIEALNKVSLPDPAAQLHKYPHQFSGGQLQRIIMALALACGPKLLLADEPTTALDVTVQAQIIALLRELVEREHLAVLFITHDLGVVASVADRLAVMQKGCLVETGSAREIISYPQHEYTSQLLEAAPVLQDETAPLPEASEDAGEAVLSVKNLEKVYPSRAGPVRAVDDVSFEIRPGECVALVGESGSGKSTVALSLLKLIDPDGGKVVFEGVDFVTATRAERRPLRRDLSVVFQNPYSSLNPRRRVVDLVGEPLALEGDLSRSERRARVLESLEAVGLGAEHLDRFPNAFSGGQRQRIAIARALITRPKLVVLDEPTAALDVSVQMQVLQLLQQLQAERGLSYLFITHDLAVVQQVAARVLVMYLGKLVEAGPVAEVFDNPKHPYTRKLLEAVPRLDRTPRPPAPAKSS